MDNTYIGHTLDVLEFEAIRRMLAERTVSAIGFERAQSLMPGADLTVIQERLQTVTEMRALLDLDEVVPLRGIKDIRSALERAGIAGASLDPEVLLDVASTLQVSRTMHAFAKRVHQQCSSPRIESLTAGLGDFQSIEKEIHQAIDSDGSIRDHASPALRRIRQAQQTMRDRTRDQLNRFIQSDTGSKALQEPVMTMRDGRYVVPVRRDHRSQVRGVVHDQSASGATIFIEPMAVVDLNNQLRELTVEERREIDRILRALTDQIRDQFGGISASIDLLGLLDYYHAAGVLSMDQHASHPRLNTQGHIVLRHARHPLLTTLSDSEDVVPLTLEVGDKVSTLVITGPNMGGKTVALKTVGLLTVMAQAGLHIPADDHAELSIFEQIFADIGDEQSIQANLSTFSSHLRHIITILEQADDRTLVLLDELGSGTDPAAGAAIGMAILERLTNRRVITVATTHYGALKEFATRTDGVENGSMVFNVDTLTPTYRFRQGIPGASYAVEIGQQLGMPEEVLRRATTLIGEDEHQLDEIIIALDKERERLHTAREEADTLRTELDQLKQDYHEKVTAYRRKEQALMDKARAEADRLLREAQATVERTVAEIREEQASRASIKIAQETIKDQRSLLAALLSDTIPAPSPSEKPAPPSRPITVGDQVWVESLEQSGTVLQDLGGRLRVLAGRLEMTVRRDDVRLQPPATNQPKQTPRIRKSAPVQVHTTRETTQELNVRGFRVEETLDAVDKFIDQAAIDDRSEVRILHGKGTGALSSAIREFLRHHVLVKSTRFAPQREGGTGVTVVEMAG
jgi:DNA mismatch repair protein MutS2